jgi:hypothetical protein
LRPISSAEQFIWFSQWSFHSLVPRDLRQNSCIIPGTQ